MISDLPKKYERQSEKIEVENLMEKVDSEWKSLHTLLPKTVSEIVGEVLSVTTLIHREKVRVQKLPTTTTNPYESCSLRGVARPWTS